MDINLSQYLKAFQKQWWLIPAMVLLTLGAGLAYSMSQTPMYEASAALLVTTNSILEDPGDLTYGLDTLARNSGITITACKILESQLMRDRVAAALSIPIEVANEYDVRCVVLPDSTILKIRVQGESPELVTDLADMLSTEGLVYINSLYEVIEIRLLDAAVFDDEPISPDHKTNLVLSVFVGLVAGVGLIVMRETLVQVFAHITAADAADKPAEDAAGGQEPLDLSAEE